MIINVLSRVVKAVSSKEARKTPCFRMGKGNAFWGRRYGSKEVVPSEVGHIREYIRNQKVREATHGSVYMKNSIIAIVGPTSSGKTAVSTELARKIPSEVISCDSMQVYKNMDIITQAPTEDVLKKVPHHLLKFLSPEHEYNAAQYLVDAEKIIKQIIYKNKTPIIVGGTGLYLKTLLDGIFDSPPKDDALREKLLKMSCGIGSEALHKKLIDIDPEAAKKIHYNDLKRIIRAIEVYEVTGVKFSEKKKEAEGILGDYEWKIFGLDIPREKLYERINNKVDSMFRGGLIEEVKKLLEMELGITARKAIGIEEIKAYIEGDTGEEGSVPTLEEIIDIVKQKTRNYAKRQLTWFRNDPRVEWIDGNRPSVEIAEEICSQK